MAQSAKNKPKTDFLSSLLGHPHNTSRENFSEFNQQTQPNPAPRFSSHDNSVKTVPVIPGEHSREILSELGLNQEQIKQYQNAGIIGI